MILTKENKKNQLIKHFGISDPDKTNNHLELTGSSVTKHFYRPIQKKFIKSQLQNTTILIGGLSPVHDYLVEGSLKKLGVKVLALPNADKKASQLGREYGTNGYCNPAYFTTGNLIKFLQNLHSQGMEKQDIIDQYVFLTAGCGDSPCRFGMYETLYRLTLENAGFEGFRILTFEQSGGMHQEDNELAIKFNLEFFLTVVNALIIGDLLNTLVFAIRPYEIEKGKTDKVLSESLDYLYQKLKDQKRIDENTFWKKALALIKLKGTANFVHLLLQQLNNNYYKNAMTEVKKRFDKIEIDRLLLKPKVKITGEFGLHLHKGMAIIICIHFWKEKALKYSRTTCALI